jgi:hypothetical protein
MEKAPSVARASQAPVLLVVLMLAVLRQGQQLVLVLALALVLALVLVLVLVLVPVLLWCKYTFVGTPYSNLAVPSNNATEPAPAPAPAPAPVLAPASGPDTNPIVKPSAPTKFANEPGI